MDKLTTDVEEHLAEAEAAGTDGLVFGPATLSEVLHLSAAEAADMLDRLHQEYAAAQRAHPDRIACLAALPMQDPATALQLGVPLFLHPGLRSATRDRTHGFREEVGLTWMCQTARAALELVDSGMLDAIPDLIVVHPHLGGVLPYVAGRISPLPGSKANHPLGHYFKTRFYADTAAATPAALDPAVRTYGANRLAFAADHPFGPMPALHHYLQDNLPVETATRIYANRVPGLTLTAQEPVT